MTFKTYLWLPLAVGLALLPTLLTYQGVDLSGDDVLYARLAADMAAGEPSFFINTHPTRLGFIVPLAALYRVFGIHDWTTIAFTLASSILAVLVVAFVAQRLYGQLAGVWAALVCGLHPVLYHSGSMGMPGIPAGFLYGFFVLGWILLVDNRVRHRRLWAFLTGLACTWAMTTRISIAPMIILTLGGFLLLSWRQNSLREIPLISFFSGGSLIGISYLLFLWWHTSNPLYFLEAAQGGFHIEGAPWIIPYEGWRFWARISGLSILRASIEGYLFAAFPIVVGIILLARTPSNLHRRLITIHLLLAVLSPLFILSHFSTSFTHWYPVRLDLRFGSALIMPLSILVAGACVRLPNIRLSPTVRLAMVVVVCITVALGLLAWTQDNFWSMQAAAASFVMACGVLGAYHCPRHFLPIILLVVLIGSWWHYYGYEYAEIQAHAAALRAEADTIPWKSSLPILTDNVTAQYLPYLHEFTSPPHVATWELEGKVTQSSNWAVRRDRPWPERYLLVWYPKEAHFGAERWQGKVPEWVLREFAKGTLVQPFSRPSQFPSSAFGFRQERPETFQMWPQAGIYQINGDKKELYASNIQQY